ncbi:MAG: hypothetical protein NTU43_09390 [Bacteroidetes bacterium]|nr:hypothetical protein [Bacteroidota bacterium]
MSKTDEKPVILAKRKNIQTIFDYCLEQKVEFKVSPRTISNDEWEVELGIDSIKMAIALGMFVRENKLDMYGMGEFSKPKPVSNGKKSDEKEKTATSAPSLTDLMSNVAADEPANALNLDLNTNNN